MAREVWKDLLIPGTYLLSDGRRVTYTPADIRNALTQGRRMLANRLRVPCCWEHDPDAKPEPRPDGADKKGSLSHANAWLARGLFGDVQRYRVKGGSLEGLVSIEDDSDADQFRRVKFVSPQLEWDYRDGAGRLYPGLSVVHVASTPTPVQHRQKPVQFSRAAAPRTGRFRSGDIHRLSSFLPGGVRAMADGTDDTDDFEGDDGDEGGGDSGAFARVIDKLKKMGINVGDAADIGDLDTRLDAILNHTGGNDADGDGVPDGAEPAESPVMMGMARVAARDNEQLGHRITRLHRTGRINAATKAKLEGKLKAAPLSARSYDRKGDLRPNPVLIAVEAYEDLPKGAIAIKPGKAGASLSRFTPVPDPIPQGRSDAKSQDAAGDKLCEILGLKPAAK